MHTWLATLAVALAACAETAPRESLGGETNWLVPCTDQNDCSHGRCLCGVCTIDCETPSECDNEFAGACISAQSDVGASLCASETNAPAGLCLPACTADVECGETFVCQSGVCTPDPGACRHSSPPSCMGLQEPCTWMEAQTLLTPCTGLFTPFSAVQCGAYDGLVAHGTDSSTSFYYDATGSLVGKNEVGLGATGCVSYDPAFTSPPECETVTPVCRSDGGAPTCDCGSEELSLECVCSNTICRSFADATANVFCEGGNPNPPTISRGCGFTVVDLSAGVERTTFVYQGSDHTLVGASSTTDLPFGECQTIGYATAIPDLTQCADYSICDLCDSGAYPACEP